MKKILVTGGSGLIGNALKEEMPDATYVSSKDYNLINENEVEKIPTSDPTCPRCGLRSFDDECANCGAKIVDKKDDDEEEYDWREHKR